jgi:hypothetical protein
MRTYSLTTNQISTLPPNQSPDANQKFSATPSMERPSGTSFVTFAERRVSGGLAVVSSHPATHTRSLNSRQNELSINKRGYSAQPVVRCLRRRHISRLHIIIYGSFSRRSHRTSTTCHPNMGASPAPVRRKAKPLEMLSRHKPN